MVDNHVSCITRGESRFLFSKTILIEQRGKTVSTEEITNEKDSWPFNFGQRAVVAKSFCIVKENK